MLRKPFESWAFQCANFYRQLQSTLFYSEVSHYIQGISRFKILLWKPKIFDIHRFKNHQVLWWVNGRDPTESPYTYVIISTVKFSVFAKSSKFGNLFFFFFQHENIKKQRAELPYLEPEPRPHSTNTMEARETRQSECWECQIISALPTYLIGWLLTPE